MATLPLHSLSASNNNATGSAVANANAENLISALVQFMSPMIREYAPSLLPIQTDAVEELQPTKAGDSFEGRNLISALTTFIAATVRSKSLSQSPSNDKDKDNEAKDSGVLENINEVTQVLTKEIARTELETMTLMKVRAHVFSKMPIRLLAFDNAGAHIHLIERDTIFGHILPTVYIETGTPSFQSAWADAETLRDITFNTRPRQERMNSLLNDVIERSAHYAILSHTWIRETPGDIIYKDWNMRASNDRGYTKIAKFCEVAARNHGLTLGWIDTVCINKESSAELDESIRSMFNWYRRAHICITYLSETLLITDEHRDSWFSRGWTLQELVAPLETFFYNMCWQKMGSSKDPKIEAFLEAATTITTREFSLCRSGDIERISLSRRMELACGRQVTREEDSSYSLMGVLGVDISIAYGEGRQRAFYRLVREVLGTKKHVRDLFNRGYDLSGKLMPSSIALYSHRHGVLDNPDEISGSFLDELQQPEPIILTQLGIKMPLLIAPALLSTEGYLDLNYVAYGEFSGMIRSNFVRDDSTTTVIYHNILDRRLYSDDPSDLPTFDDEDPNIRGLIVRTFGIFNFGHDSSGNIVLPRVSPPLDLLCKGGNPGKLVPSNIAGVRGGTLTVFELDSEHDNYSIPECELERHGLQILTIYL